MSKMLKMTISIGLLLALSITALIWVGRQQAPSPFLIFLHLTDCKPPCWIDIVPGQTSLEEAQNRIKAVYGGSPFNVIVNDRGVYQIDNTQQGFQLLVSFENSEMQSSIVENFSLVFRPPDNAPPRLTLGQLIWLFGAPDARYEQDSAYSDLHIIAITERSVCSISKDQEIDFISFSKNPLDILAGYVPSWPGFRKFSLCYDG
jgi:hypothetical protein